MTCGNQTIAMLALLSLLTPGTGRITPVQNVMAASSSKTFTIAGYAGVAGVEMQGLPGNVVTDNNGAYSARVPRGWSGRITPTKPGYQFEPYAREYEPIGESYTNDNFTAYRIPCVISGNAGVPGATMQGLPGSPVTDENGNYSVLVDYGWSGRVRPDKQGYAFDPAERMYVDVTAGQANQDYLARIVTFTISGQAGVPGVLIQGLPGTPVTDQKGSYRAVVPYGWTGMVVPQKAGYVFIPPARTYRSVGANLDGDFAAELRTVTISDRIMYGADPIEGAVVTAEPGGYSAKTDSQGRYLIKVPYGWSGRLVPSAMDVEDIGPFINVTNDIIDGKPVATPAEYSGISQPRAAMAFSEAGVTTARGDVLVIPTTQMTPESIAQTREDLRVMLHILREKLSEPRMILGVLRDYGGFFDSDRRVEALYLQGTAAVFVLEVDFPYSFPTHRPVEGEPGKEAVDPVWERARQRLYSPGGSRRSYGQAGQTQQMSFEQFQEELMRSLKHAANLRHVDPNELAILTIVAPSEDARAGGAPVNNALAGARDNPDEAMLRQVYGDEYAAMMIAQQSAPATTVLTIQAKKADIDAFATGDLDFEQFRQKVRTFVY